MGGRPPGKKKAAGRACVRSYGGGAACASVREETRAGECVRARVFGGGGRWVRVRTSLFFYLSYACIYFFCACIYFFCAFLENRQNKLNFSVSADFFVCVLSRTEKSYNYSVGFRIFLSGYFGTGRIIVIFLCVPEKTHRKIRYSQDNSSFQS